MIIFPHSSSLETIYVSRKTKPDVIHVLIDEKLITPDDPLRPIIEAFINHIDIGELWIKNRVRLIFH